MSCVAFMSFVSHRFVLLVSFAPCVRRLAFRAHRPDSALSSHKKNGPPPVKTTHINNDTKTYQRALLSPVLKCFFCNQTLFQPFSRPSPDPLPGPLPTLFPAPSRSSPGPLPGPLPALSRPPKKKNPRSVKRWISHRCKFDCTRVISELSLPPDYEK